MSESSRLSLVTHGRGWGGSFICSVFSGQGAGGLESLSYEWTGFAMSEGRPMPFSPLKPTLKQTRAWCRYAGRKSCPRMKWRSPLDLARGTRWGTSGQQGGCRGSPQSWEYSVLIHVLLFIYLFSTFIENLPLFRPDPGSWANVAQQALTEQSLEGNCSIAR